MHTTWSRRALLVAAASALPAAQLPRKIRLGVIGYDGHLSEILSRLPDYPDVELVAVADAESDPRATESALKNRFVAKARRYRDYPEMLAAERLDCAAVCNHNGGRAAAIVACVDRKLDVIAEKPFAISRAEFQAVVAPWR
jgi:predicted dehydrogenase